jgi:hypothetical protein
MGQYFLANTDITTLNKLAESEVTELTSLTVDKPAFTMRKIQESQVIRMICLNRKFIFDIPV